MDIRREADILASDRAAIPVSCCPAAIAPTLVLDNVSPADLISMMAFEFSVARELVTAFPGPVLMLGPDSPGAGGSIHALQRNLGRSLVSFTVPPASVDQRLAILTMHQPVIEKRWRIELAPAAVKYAASCQSPLVASPGAMLQWLERSAARLSLYAKRGPLAAVALEGQADTAKRQTLLALARQQSTEQLESSLKILTLKRATIDVAWHERKRNGTLRTMTTDDLRYELELELARP